MRQLHVKMSMSLDGFVGGPKGEVDWIFRTMDPKAQAWTVSSLWDASLHIMGAKTYRDMVSWWPYSTEAFAPPMNEIPKAVFTQHGAASLRNAVTTQAVKDATAARDKRGEGVKEADPKILNGWTDAYVADGSLKDEIAKLKQESGKPILAHGGAGFVRNLIATGLVDEFRMLVHPVVLGSGLPIFSGLENPLSLKLVNSTSFPSGVVAQLYRSA